MKRRAMKKNKINAGSINMFQSIFKTFLLSLTIISQVHFAYAQTASILPPAKTTFFDSNGNPLTSGTVESFIPSTNTHKTTWQDAAETIPNLNPLTLDAAGRTLLLGSGSYRQVVKDRNNNLIWDQVTSSTGSGSGGSTATGDGDLVGTIKPWAGITAPNQYMFTYGQTLNRITFSALFNAITSIQAVFCTSGSPIVTGLSDTTNFWIGMSVETSCVPAGFTTIIAKTSSSVTFAVNANATVNTNVTFFPWGNGNHTTTFTLPDFRGLIPIGNNIMGGVASSNISDTYFGATSASSSGALGGATGGGQTLTLAQLPTGITATGTGSVSVTAGGGRPNIAVTDGTVSSFSTDNTAGAQNVPVETGGSWSSVASLSGSTGTVTTTSNNTSGAAFSIIQPSKTINYIIKVTPDANSATASGVTDLGGMTGSIACGTGIVCTGNTISAIQSGVSSLGGSTGVIGLGQGLQIAGNVLSSLGGDNNVLNAQSADYPIVAGDNGKVIYETGGPFTVTLPAVGGFATNAVVSVCNGNANSNGQRAVRLSGFPNPIFKRLYMQQCITVGIENGAWISKVIPGRFHPTFTPTLDVDNGGSDNNDGYTSNAAANALQTMGGCFTILQVEYDLSGNIQPICSPTGGQTLIGSWSIIGPLIGASVINVTGNSGVAILQPTASAGFVLQLSDFAPYMISTNVTWDCTGGSAGCATISFHQQTGADINAGSTLKGNATGHFGISCDSMCKINVGANPLTVTGAFSSVFGLVEGSVLNVNSGITISASANIPGSLITEQQNSTFSFAGALIAGAGISIGEIFTLRSGSTGCLNSNFTTSGSFGAARQWSVLNNSFFANASANAVPGSTPGITTSATFAAGSIANSGLSSGGC